MSEDDDFGFQGYVDGTSGHQGDASLAAEPTRRKRIPTVYEMIADCGSHGLTVKELRDNTGWHHGVASSALSNLHREGHIVKLAARRERCGIYILPQFVSDGQATVQYRRNSGLLSAL